MVSDTRHGESSHVRVRLVHTRCPDRWWFNQCSTVHDGRSRALVGSSRSRADVESWAWARRSLTYAERTTAWKTVAVPSVSMVGGAMGRCVRLVGIDTCRRTVKPLTVPSHTGAVIAQRARRRDRSRLSDGRAAFLVRARRLHPAGPTWPNTCGRIMTEARTGRGLVSATAAACRPDRVDANTQCGPDHTKHNSERWITRLARR